MFVSIHAAVSPRQATAVACLLLIASFGVQAQVNPSAPKPFVEEIRQQERERAIRGQQERPVDALQPAAPKAHDKRLPDNEAPCFRIDRLILVGEHAQDFQWALAAAAGATGDDSPVGRCLGTEGVNVVLARLQQVLIARGWVTTRVLAAPQDLTHGTLTLSLVPGRIAAIRFAEDSTSKSWLPTLRTAIPAQPGDLLNLRDIEQGLENLKRLPTAEADIQIEPSKAANARPGDSDLVIKYTQKFPLRTTLSLDDSGTQATGKVQAGATIAWDNPLGLNDLFYVSLNHDAFNHRGSGTSGQLTQQFGQNASAAVGAYANGKLGEADVLYDAAGAEADPDTKAALYAQADELRNDWKEGGVYRITAHVAVGGLTGGASGAAGAAASSIAIPAIGQQIASMDLPLPVKEALIAASSVAIGVAIGGSAGAASAFNETTNNFLTASDLRSRDQKIKACQAKGDPACEVRVGQEYDRESANNTGQLKGSSLLEKMGLETVRSGLEQLLLDPKVSEETRGQARRSIAEIDTAINVIDKAQVLRDSAEIGLLVVDVATLGEMAGARTLTVAVVKEIVGRRTGAVVADDLAARITNNFYRDGIDATSWTRGKPSNMEANAIEHWGKHGKEFPEYPSLAQYTEAARHFRGQSTRWDANQDCEQWRCDPLRPLLEHLCSTDLDGVPKTMFRPDPALHGYKSNMDFWNSK